MSKKLILADYNHMLNKYFYGFKDIFIERDGEKINTGTILGFSLFVERLFNKYDNFKLIFCMDGIRTKNRIDEEYKSNRESKKQVHELTDDIIDILSNINEIYFAKGEYSEADDLIASLAYSSKDKFDEIIIYSGDKDFWQLLDDFKVSNEYNKGFKFVDSNLVFQKFGVSQSDLLSFRVLDGDKSDNLKPPVPRIRTEFKKEVAEKWKDGNIDTFIQLMYEYKDDKRWGKSALSYLENIDKVENNLRIMDLKKYSNPDNRITNYKLFKNKTPDKNKINFYGLRQYEVFLYDYLKSNKNVICS